MPSIASPRHDERLPIYQRLKDDLAARIAQGEWRPGDAIPAESELATRHGVAVGTVRKAIEGLVQQGWLERRQGRGTFVRRAEFGNALFRFFRLTDAGGRPLRPEGRLLARRAGIAGAAADGLRLRRGDRVLWLSRLRLVDGQPLLLEEIALPLPRFERIAALPVEVFRDLLYPMYEREAGQVVARAHEHISFGRADEAAAEHLGVRRGSPVAVIDRVAFGFDDRALEWRRSQGPAERFGYDIDIR